MDEKEKLINTISDEELQNIFEYLIIANYLFKKGYIYDREGNFIKNPALKND